MKNILKKFFSKEETILFYVNEYPYLCDTLEVKEDKEGRYIIALAGYSLHYKKWNFYRNKTRIYIDDSVVRYMDHNLLKEFKY